MIVYNISIKIDPGIESEWVKWQKEEHIPEIMTTGCFTEYKFYRLLPGEDSNDIVYIVQFFAPTIEHYNNYIDNKSQLLREKSFTKWGDSFIAFRTLMQAVN